MVTDDDRRNLYEAPEGTLGRVPAATLMALLPPVGWSELATQAGVDAQGVAIRGEMAELRAANGRAARRAHVARLVLAADPCQFRHAPAARSGQSPGCG